MIEQCRLCPRECAVMREEKNGNGYCNSGSLAKVARAGLHFWEEPCISGIRGSGAVFFCGCSLRCVYCQNDAISHDNLGQVIGSSRLSAIFHHLQELGAHNINLVTPTHFVPAIIDALKEKPLSIPLVYNTSSYEKIQTIELLKDYADVYLADIKYVSSDLSFRFSQCRDYFEVAKLAVDQMVNQNGTPVFDSEGMMRRGVLLRHLILPKHTQESQKVIDYICSRYSNEIPLSLMSQYVPTKRTAAYPEINRRITKREYDKVINYALQKGMTNLYLQSLSAADDKFIPAFDLTGV